MIASVKYYDDVCEKSASIMKKEHNFYHCDVST